MSAQPSLSPAAAADRIAAGVPVLDVREPAEYAAGHIDGARLVPLGELPDRLGEVPAGEPIIVVCRSGNRSSLATALLRAAGRDAWNLDGGMDAWIIADQRTVRA